MRQRILLIALVFVCIFSFTACGDPSRLESEAKTPSRSSVQKGRDYQRVVDTFKEKGFTNIRTEALEDLITGWTTKDGEVESVSVDGDVSYSADVWYPKDVEVIITYHTFPSKQSKEKITEINPSEETLSAITETNDETESSDPEDKPNNLKEHVAKKAFELYGEVLYPYGFKCHWFKALEEHTQHEDGSWFFKVGVTITNQYGASREAVASAYINNTTERVEDFVVE